MMSASAAEYGVVGKMPHHAKPRPLPKVLSDEEVEALIAMPNLNAPTGLRNRCMIHLMLRAGLRTSEVCGLHLRDLNIKTQVLTIPTDVAKYGREATVPIDNETIALINRWRQIRRPYAALTKAPWLFVTLRGGQVHRSYTYRMVRRYAQRAGIDRRVWPHMLRHTFATTLLRRRYNIREVQRLVRHADLRSTQIYLELNDEDLFDRMRHEEF